MRPGLQMKTAAWSALAAAVLFWASPAAFAGRDGAPFGVSAVETIGFTVSDMERAVRFYTSVLPFRTESDVEVSGRGFELLTGVFGARARVVRLRLGDETIELTEYLAPRGQPMPPDVQANDRIFQHAAIVVGDMTAAYRHLRASGVRHASTGPQRLPDWNPNAGGIRAFYFRDPDGHFLELIEFPPGKGKPRWQGAGAPLFRGIDHTAIVIDDTDTSLAFYRDVLGLAIAGASENHDIEQERLNNVFGARLRITTLRALAGPGIELLEYLAPRTGRAVPPDLRANDVAHWETTLLTHSIEPLLPLARRHKLALVSPGPVDPSPGSAHRFARAALVRDPDGHGIRIAVKRDPADGIQ